MIQLTGQIFKHGQHFFIERYGQVHGTAVCTNEQVAERECGYELGKVLR